MESLRGQASYSLVYNRLRLIVSWIGACPWDGSQVRLVTGWPFLQSLLQFCPCISFRQEKFCIKNFEGVLMESLHDHMFLSLHGVPSKNWRSSFQVKSTPLLGISVNAASMSHRSLSHSRALGFSRSLLLPPTYIITVAVFYPFPCPLAFSPFAHYT